jgi:predicted alpha/beta hydrolase family esterase
MRVLTVPGWNGSGPSHWQTIWERKKGYERVYQRDWQNPEIEEWTARLAAAISAGAGDAVLVAHSLGCLTVGHWAAAYPRSASQVRSAFLVAPPDVGSRPGCPQPWRRFAATASALPFRSLVVASESDPNCKLRFAEETARGWGSQFLNAGHAGHINVASGHGPWPQGEKLLRGLIAEVPERRWRSAS